MNTTVNQVAAAAVSTNAAEGSKQTLSVSELAATFPQLVVYTPHVGRRVTQAEIAFGVLSANLAWREQVKAPEWRKAMIAEICRVCGGCTWASGVSAYTAAKTRLETEGSVAPFGRSKARIAVYTPEALANVATVALQAEQAEKAKQMETLRAQLAVLETQQSAIDAELAAKEAAELAAKEEAERVAAAELAAKEEAERVAAAELAAKAEQAKAEQAEPAKAPSTKKGGKAKA